MNEFDLEEEKNIQNEIITASKTFDWIEKEVLCVVINQRQNLLFKNLDNIKICGKYLADWVKTAFFNCKTEVLNEEDDIIEAIKVKSVGYSFVFVAFNETPLLQKNTFVEIMDYFSINNLNSLKINRGFVFKVDYLPSVQKLESLITKQFRCDDFLIVDNAENFIKASGTLRNRILKFHQDNGVIILSKNNVFIDADVKIEKGVVVYANNFIKGNSVIKEGVVLEENNTIINSFIAVNANITGCKFLNYELSNCENIQPFSVFKREI